MLKTCTVCGKEKPLSEYYFSNGKPIARCKVCHQEKYIRPWRDGFVGEGTKYHRLKECAERKNWLVKRLLIRLRKLYEDIYQRALSGEKGLVDKLYRLDKRITIYKKVLDVFGEDPCIYRKIAKTNTHCNVCKREKECISKGRILSL